MCRLKTMIKVFGYVFLVIALLGGCAVAIEKAGSINEAPIVQATSGSENSDDSTAGMQTCLDLVETKPGDVAFIESHGWKIVCSQSGDSELDASGD